MAAGSSRELNVAVEDDLQAPVPTKADPVIIPAHGRLAVVCCFMYQGGKNVGIGNPGITPTPKEYPKTARNETQSNGSQWPALSAVQLMLRSLQLTPSIPCAP
eukprot:6472286-Amphidinium_carterae.1